MIADIDKKIEELKNEKKCNAWNPRHGETYYCVGACGNVFDEEFQNRNHDNAHFSIGNYFRTKEDLEKKGFVMVGQTS